VAHNQAVTILTFPGVIVHEMAHTLLCRLTRTRVIKVRLFRLGNPAGYVVHEKPRGAWKNIFIGTGPFFVNTLAGLLIALSAALLPDRAGTTSVVMHAVLIWLAISVVMHSFPSTGDAGSIWAMVCDRGCPLAVKVAAVPVAGFIYLGALGSRLWLDLLYAAVVAIGVPLALGLRPW